jgi:hypothetical protein
VQHVQTHNARPKAHRTSHALPAEEPDSDISPPPEEDAPQGRTKRASNARVDESPTEGKPKRPTGKKRKAAEGEEETQPPLPWEVQARPGKKPPASKTKASPAKIESKAEPQGSKSQKSEASERAPAPGKFPNLQPAFEVADVFSVSGEPESRNQSDKQSRAERHTPEPISMDDITLVPDSSPLPPRIPAKPPTPVPSPPARKEAPAPVAAAASLPKKKGRGKQPRVPKSVPEPEAVEVVEPIHLDEPNRSSSRRKRDTDPEPEPERERDLEVERRPTRRERDSDRGDTERERDGRAPRSPYHPKQERGDRSSDDSFRPDADGERMSTLWSRGAMRTQAPASPARGVKRVVQVVYERSAKKARFSAPPRPATGAVAEVTEVSPFI